MTRFDIPDANLAEKVEAAEARAQKANGGHDASVFRGGATNWMVPMANENLLSDPFAAAELIPNDPNFNQQWHLRNTTAGQFDLNVTDVWDDYTGDGVRVVVIDTGIDRDHPDLLANMNFGIDWDYQDGDTVPEPVGSARSQHHGTAVAGIVGAANNSVGGVGVAYDAELVSFRGYGLFGDFGSEVWQDAAGLGDTVGNPTGDSTDADIVTMSAGSGSTVFYYTNDNANAVSDMSNNANNGRDGLGTIMVKSAGNSRAGANSSAREEGTAELWDSTRFVINVAAVERDGDITNYSSPGANVLVSAFAPSTGQSPGIFTTDRAGTDGYNTNTSANGGDYTSGFNGTSAAAPQVAGVVALMLEANPDLGWRDVQKILALSARQSGSEVGSAAIGNEQAIQGTNRTWFWNDTSDGNMKWNGGGFHFSNDYGFGIVDAKAAVRLAETWELSGTSGVGSGYVAESRDMDGTNVTTNYSTGFVSHTATFSNNINVQHVNVNVDFDIDDLADMEIFLVSPNGTRIQLINDTGDTQAYDTGDAVNEANGNGGTGNRGWDFGSVAFLGENGNGTWTVQIRNDDGSTNGTFSTSDVDLTIYGDTDTTDDLFVYTNEFSDYDGVVNHLTTANGGSGTNTMNAAAVDSNTTIDLLGNTANIDGVAMTSVLNIDRVFTGDGNDSVVGDGISEFINTGRGNDTVEGGSGEETIQGGDGNDSLSGGAGDDTIEGGDGNDTLEGQGGADRLIGGNGNDTFLYRDGQDAPTTASEQLTGGAGFDRILLQGAGTYVLNTGEFGINVSSVEEIEFSADGANIDKTVILTNKELDSAGEFATALRIDGNSNTGSDDRIIINMVDTYGTALDISAWTFQTWVQSGNQDDRLTINGTSADNNIVGTSRNDSIFGNAGDDTINGGDGDDTLVTGSGADSMLGGNGNDLFIKSDFLPPASDVFNGGAGDDTLTSTANYSGSVTFNLASGRASVAGAERDTLISIENLNIGGSADVIGNSGANIINMIGTGNNEVDGGAGNDTLSGGAGNDTLISGSGADSLLGGTGNDRLVKSDALSSAADVFNGGSGDDTLETTLSWSNTVTFNLAAGNASLGTDVRDTLISIENIEVGGRAAVIGSSEDNRITATGTAASDGNDLDGGAGDDTILGNAGDDTLTSGTGEDSLDGGADDDLLIKTDFMAPGESDTFNGGTGDDTLEADTNWGSGVTFNLASGRSSVGGDDRDVLVGIENLRLGGSASAIGTIGANSIVGLGTGGNNFDGGAGNDTLDGGGGNDTLTSGSGDDTLLGGDGNDLLVKSDLLDGGDVFNGGAGNDTLDATSVVWGPAAIFNLATGEALVGLDPRDDLISIENVVVGGAAVVVGSSAANLIEGTSVTLSSSANNFSGGGGDDILLGGLGDDTLDGGNADDSLDGGSEDDRLLGGNGDDTLRGGTGDDFLDGGNNNDTLLGESNEDTLLGRGGDDDLDGGAGDDIVNGGDGADTLDGGTGSDTLTYSGDTTGVTVRLFSNTASGGWAEGDDISNFEHLTLGTGDDFGQGNLGDNVIRGAAGNDTLVGLAGDDTLNGGGGNDRIFGDAGADSLIGSIGNDTLTYAPDTAGVVVQLFNGSVSGGLAEGDTISGFENVEGGQGNDILQGTGGNNILDGRQGNDTLNGLGGDDTLLGGSGNDQILSGTGADELNGGTGFDMLSYFSDNTGVNVSLFFNSATGGNATGDTISNFENITGGVNDDTLQGSAGGNVLFGFNGDDTINGLGGNDTLRGGFGEDYILGGGGNDRLLGQVNADTLVGGAGNDTLTGGTAGDTFIFTGNFGQDTISDFGFADVARVGGTAAGFNTFGDYDVNSDGLVNAVDAGLTSNVTAGPGGDLTLTFNLAGNREIFFDNVGFLNAGDLIFV
ncbi:MAG: S8 family serine peptidase [Pseudomonadota bacterium]